MIGASTFSKHLASGDLSIILLTFVLRNKYFHIDFTAHKLGEDDCKSYLIAYRHTRFIKYHFRKCVFLWECNTLIVKKTVLCVLDPTATPTGTPGIGASLLRIVLLKTRHYPLLNTEMLNMLVF